MSIAIVTGASSGMGREFVFRLAQQKEIDCIWVIARRSNRLNELREKIGDMIRPVALDLTDSTCIERFRDMLDREQPDVRVLVNCSGFGRFGRYDDVTAEDSLEMIDLNCKALVALTEYTLPYMKRDSEIYQLCSLSAFQPVPYINTYAATKAFVLSYSRGLNAELKERGIHVMAVCPGWVKTEFFDRALAADKSAVTYFNRMYEAKDVVDTAVRDMKKRRDVSIHGLPVKAQVFGVKHLPHKLVMNIWLKQQKHK